MGVLDDLSDTLSHGTAIVERNAKTLRLRAKIGEVQSRRRIASATLGASLYEDFCEDASIRAGHEQLFDDIARCDTELKDLNQQIADIEAQARAAAQQPQHNVAQIYCPSCGAPLGATARFCSACGQSLIDYQPNQAYQQAPGQNASYVQASSAQAAVQTPECQGTSAHQQQPEVSPVQEYQIPDSETDELKK